MLPISSKSNLCGKGDKGLNNLNEANFPLSFSAKGIISKLRGTSIGIVGISKMCNNK